MAQVNDLAPGIAWQTWSDVPFGRARAEEKRVLLWVTAAWSEGCAAMASRSYADPAVIAEIEAHYVPVRVDADERPDLADRYDLGGLPTTVVLDPDGTLVGGGTFVPAARLCAALARLATREDAPHRVRPATPVADDLSDAQLLAAVEASHDHRYGGCGVAPKFPHVAAVRLALRAAGDEPTQSWARRSLDAMGWGELSDEAGGFFRYCDGADWTAPRREQLLVVNATLLELFVEAAAAGHGVRYLDRARAVVAFIERELRRADGTWRTAAGLGASRVLTDANAVTVSAMLAAARANGGAALAARAIATLENVLLAAYRPGDGVAHCGGGIRGLLTDTVAMARACLDAWETAGQMPHRMMAEELTQYALRTMWDADEGGFFDRAAALSADDPVPVTALKPFVLNCEAATVLYRLARETGDVAYGERADATLVVLRPGASAQGPLAAHYLLARGSAEPGLR